MAIQIIHSESWRRTREEMQVCMDAVKGDMVLAGARDEPFLVFCLPCKS